MLILERGNGQRLLIAAYTSVISLQPSKVPQIEDFTDTEAVIKSVLQLRNSVLIHKTDGTHNDSVQKEIQHIQLICNSGSSG